MSTRKTVGVPAWKARADAKPNRRPFQRKPKDTARPVTSTTDPMTRWRDRLPAPAVLTDDEVRAQKRANRKVGTIVLLVCVLISIAASWVFLTMNRDTADEGAPAVPSAATAGELA